MNTINSIAVVALLLLITTTFSSQNHQHLNHAQPHESLNKTVRIPIQKNKQNDELLMSLGVKSEHKKFLTQTGKHIINEFIDSENQKFRLQQLQLISLQNKVESQHLLTVDHAAHLINHFMSIVKLSTQFGFIYYGQIQIGSRLQSFDVLFDTGSTILWLTDVDCSSCENSGINQHFSCPESQSCHSFGTNITIRYGIGVVNGIMESDSIQLGELTAVGQKFIDIHTMQDLPRLPAQGLIGLNIASDDGIDPLLDTLRFQNQIDQSIFSMYLSVQHQSELIIGGYDENLMENQNMIYCPNIATNFWAVDIRQMSFQGGKLNQPINIGYQPGDFPMNVRAAIVDSGSSVLVIPTDIVNHILQSLSQIGIACRIQNGKQLASCPVFDINDFPDLIINLCGNQLVIPAKQIVLCDSFQCILKIMQCPLTMPIVILGDTFMQQYYTTFDKDSMRVGFAQAVNSYHVDYLQYSTDSIIFGLKTLIISIIFFITLFF